jgi:hypothetical protein
LKSLPRVLLMRETRLAKAQEKYDGQLVLSLPAERGPWKMLRWSLGLLTELAGAAISFNFHTETLAAIAGVIRSD